jgi:tRNA(Ile)-lysidine synthetase-like protein
LARALVAPAEEPRTGGGARGPIVVAWSGGLDSTVLLDLVLHDERVRRLVGPPIAAHLDHAMRPDSAADARALRDTAGAWGVEFRTHRLASAPNSEAEARELRYAWLGGVATAVDAREIWTAHHADDQIETVLFRVLRGTGLHGLEGIPARRDRIRRPFLQLEDPLHRADLSAYSRARALPIRIDASNEQPLATRNRLRHEVLPLLEDVVPGSRSALLRLARNAGRTASELDAVVDRLLTLDGAADGAPGGPANGPSADLWAGADRPLRRALLRGAARTMGVALSEGATLAAMDLPPDAQSGRGVDLPGGLRFEREFDRWRLIRSGSGGRKGALGEGGSLEIPDPTDGYPGADGPAAEGSADLGGRTVHARWRVGGEAPDHIALVLPASAFPLVLRAWQDGDRITLPFGTTSVAKAWSESRVPRRERRHRWVLADGRGQILAAEGLGPARSDGTIEGPPIRLQLRLDVDA